MCGTVFNVFLVGFEASIANLTIELVVLGQISFVHFLLFVVLILIRFVELWRSLLVSVSVEIASVSMIVRICRTKFAIRIVRVV